MHGQYVKRTDEHVLSAIFVEQIIAYLTFPDTTDKLMEIQVLQDQDLYDAMKKRIAEKKLGERIQVQEVSLESSKSLSDSVADILIIGDVKRSENKELIGLYKNNPILLISSLNNSWDEGSDITFMIVNDKLKFDISKSSLDRKNIRVSSRLMRLAISYN